MKLFYRELGTGTENLIILHGLFGSSDNWLTLSKMLAPRFHIYLPDQRNHGQSPHSDEFDYSLMAEDIHQFIKENAISEPVVIGHSMGGKAAMSFAIRHPSIVRRLVVVDIAPKSYPVQHDRILDGLNAIPVNILHSRNEADEMLAQYVNESPVRQFLLKNLQRKTAGSGFEWKINLSALTKNISSISAAVANGRQFHEPTLFIRGRRSDYILDVDMDIILARFPHARLVTLDTGHWVQAENPQAFAHEIISFMDS